jgi:hypothetical protein
MNARPVLAFLACVSLAQSAAPLIPRTFPETILVAKPSAKALVPFFEDVPVEPQQLEAELSALKERQAALDARLRQLTVERNELLKRKQILEEKLGQARPPAPNTPAPKNDR